MVTQDTQAELDHQVNKVQAHQEIIRRVLKVLAVHAVFVGDKVSEVVQASAVHAVELADLGVLVELLNVAHMVHKAQAVTRVHRASKVSKERPVTMASTATQDNKGHEAPPTASESSLPGTVNPKTYQYAHEAHLSYGVVSLYCKLPEMLVTMDKTSALLVLASDGSTPCHRPSAITARSADTPAETESRTGLQPRVQLPLWLLWATTSNLTFLDAAFARPQPTSSQSTPKPRSSPPAPTDTEACGLAIRSLRTPRLATAAADSPSRAQARVLRTFEPAHTSSA